MPCSFSGIKMIIWRVGLRTLETPIPHPRILVGTQRKSCHYPQDLRSFTKNRNLEIGNSMFMVWVSSWNKCDAARHHKVNRAYGDANFSTSSHLSHRFSFMTRHQGTSANDRVYTQRSHPKSARWHTKATLRLQSSPNPSGLSILLEESSLGNRKPSVRSTDVHPWSLVTITDAIEAGSHKVNNTCGDDAFLHKGTGHENIVTMFQISGYHQCHVPVMEQL